MNFKTPKRPKDQLAGTPRPTRTLWIIIAGVLLLAIVALVVIIPFLPPDDDADALIVRGHQQFTAGDFPAAIDTFNRAIRANPRKSMPHAYLGLIAQRQERFDDAEACFKKAIELDPASAPHHYSLALLYLQVNRLDEAEVEYHASVKLAPKAQYVLLYANIAERRKLPPEELTRRLRLTADVSANQAASLAKDNPEGLPLEIGLLNAWTVAAKRLLDFHDTHGLLVAARSFTDPNAKPALADFAARILKNAGAPFSLLQILDAPDPDARKTALAALEKLTARKLDFSPDADSDTRAAQLAKLRNDPQLKPEPSQPVAQEPEPENEP